jgi:hypothetical protein
MKILGLILISIVISIASNGQGFLEMDTIKTPNELLDVFSGLNFITIHVDFNGDGLKDYICQPDISTNPVEPYTEIWINSAFKKVKSVPRYIMDYDYFRFVNIDSDPEPEIYSASGYSDGIDYCFIDQNLKTGKDSILFYFNPIILENDNIYWGYPWDIENLIVKNEGGSLKVRCSLDHEIIRDGVIIEPEWQEIFPIICFTGHSTQPDVHIGQINKFEWLDINDLLERTISKK